MFLTLESPLEIHLGVSWTGCLMECMLRKIPRFLSFAMLKDPLADAFFILLLEKSRQRLFSHCEACGAFCVHSKELMLQETQDTCYTKYHKCCQICLGTGPDCFPTAPCSRVVSHRYPNYSQRYYPYKSPGTFFRHMNPGTYSAGTRVYPDSIQRC